MSKSLIEFWSDIENVEQAPTYCIQIDILAYLRKIEVLEQQAADLLGACESALAFVEELKKHGIDNWSDEEKLRKAIAKAKGEF